MNTHVPNRQEELLSICHVLARVGYKPYRSICVAETSEIISYPFPRQDGQIGIMLRKPGDPTTIREYVIPFSAVVLAITVGVDCEIV